MLNLVKVNMGLVMKVKASIVENVRVVKTVVSVKKVSMVVKKKAESTISFTYLKIKKVRSPAMSFSPNCYRNSNCIVKT